MTAHIVTPAWARDFNNQRRHCYELTNGTRMLNGGHEPCTREHDPKLVGVTEWLRFIRYFGRWSTDNPFAPTDQPGPNDPRYFLLNEVDGHQASDGRITYSETYLRQASEDWGLKPVFRVFLDNEAGWARIECYDEELVGACERTLTEVENSYKVPA